MKTALISPASAALSASPETTGSPAPAPSPGGPGPAVGRRSGLNAQMAEALCAAIRETGASDNAAAARVGVHPSTVLRWKRDCPDFSILLRVARGEFREAQLAIIYAEEAAGRAASWRAAAWVLERIFPEDYAPRATERARFQELYEARCPREVEGWEGEGETIRQSDHETIRGEACDRGGENVQNAGTSTAQPATHGSGLPVRALQNVQNPSEGSHEPRIARMTPMEETSAKSAKSVVQIRSSLPEEVLQNVQNAGASTAQPAAEGSGLPVRVLQNVQNPLEGSHEPQIARMTRMEETSAKSAKSVVQIRSSLPEEVLQNVQNGGASTGQPAAEGSGLPVRASQNVQNPSEGSHEPQIAQMTRMEQTSAESAKSVVQIRSSLPEEVLQNVQNGGASTAQPATHGSGLPVRALQNVQNPSEGSHGPPIARMTRMEQTSAESAKSVVQIRSSFPGEALQNVQNSAPKRGTGATHAASIHVEDRVSQVVEPGTSRVEHGREED